MSRCFRYPPPGYTRKDTSGEALTESIKLQRVEEKARKERKKEKKREKKEKKAQINGEFESEKNSHKKRHRDEWTEADKMGGNCQNIIVGEMEHPEKSSLTEEHGRPVGKENSSDSTLNSSKKQKQITPPNARQNFGNIIRIRLPLQRHKDPEVLPSKEQPCFLERNEGASVRQMHEPASSSGSEQGVRHPCSTSKNTELQQPSSLMKEKPCLSSVAAENLVNQEKLSRPCNLCNSCPPSLALNFRDVVENWVPPLIQNPKADMDDLDWLFDTKHKQNQTCGDIKCDVGAVDLRHGNLWPRACYLPEADVYALPFTLPF